MDVLVAAGRRWRSVSDSIREEMDPRRFDAYLDAVAAFPVDVPRHSDGQPDWRALPIESIRVRRWASGDLRCLPFTPTRSSQCATCSRE